MFANSIASHLLGVNTGDQLEKLGALLDSVEGTDREYVKNKYLLSLTQPATTNVEFRLIDSTGHPIWLRCDAYMVEKNRFIYLVVHDFTKGKEHEDYLVEYGAKKNTLLDTLVHQLNGSLMLMNNLALAAGGLKVNSSQPALDQFVSVIHNTSNHCIDIIDDLLKKEHTESPGIHVKFTRLDVVKLVNYIFVEMKKVDSTRSLIFETTSHSISVNTDNVKLLQVINNLASNALKFTRAHDEIRISLHETPHSVVISVADTGIGIPASLQPFLFEKHGPARRTGLNGERSIGLGLSICKHLTELLAGRIWFESKEGVGTRFFVEISKE